MKPKEEGSITILHKGKPYTAHYEVGEDGIVTVIAPFGKDSAYVGSTPPTVLARMILRGMILNRNK